MTYANCAENLFLDLAYWDKEDQFDALWSKLKADPRITVKHDDYFECFEHDAEAIKSEYGIKLFKNAYEDLS